MIEFTGEGHLLTDSHIKQANEILQLEQPILDALQHAAELVRKDDRFQELILDSHRRVVSYTMDAAPFNAVLLKLLREVKEQESCLKTRMGEQSGMFAVLLMIVLLEWTVSYYRFKGMPDEILMDTMSDLSIWMRHYYAEYGVWGLGNLDWLHNHLGGRLYRLGRLQFIGDTFKHSVIVLRHVHDGQVVVCSEGGIEYRSDGRVDGTNRVYDHEFKWTARFEQSPEHFIGNPILPSGLAGKETVRLPASEWHIVLRRDDPVLEIHIAEGSRMAHEECKESLHRALVFYREFFPQQSFRSFVCTSWLLDSQLQTILPASSNIVKFQKLFHLFPVLSDEGETYQRVFGTRTIVPETANRDTALRRAILDYASAGHRLYAAGGLLLV